MPFHQFWEYKRHHAYGGGFHPSTILIRPMRVVCLDRRLVWVCSISVKWPAFHQKEESEPGRSPCHKVQSIAVIKKPQHSETRANFSLFNFTFFKGLETRAGHFFSQEIKETRSSIQYADISDREWSIMDIENLGACALTRAGCNTHFTASIWFASPCDDIGV